MICEGSADIVDKACTQAGLAFRAFAETSREDRAKLLRRMAWEIDTRVEDITDMASRESGLPIARLEGECTRTTGQLRLFADHIMQGDYLDRRHDAAFPERKPTPRPDLRLIQRPVGPVAVFGASNFPLAFSTAGGDTTAALAAGCPVVVKGHSGHPGTCEIVAEAILSAIEACNLPKGVFSLVQSDNHETGTALVQHPAIKAVAFTGSLAGGRALFDLCTTRPDPIPFYGELGSLNPVFVLPHAAKARAVQIGEGWAASLTLGVGQFCTKPGMVILPEDDEAAFIAGVRSVLATASTTTMLTDNIARAYRAGCRRTAELTGVEALGGLAGEGRSAGYALFQTTARAWLDTPTLSEEVFGPLGIVVTLSNSEEYTEIAEALNGQLTCTLQLDQGDHELATTLLPVLEEKAGRLLANGFPTGVEVADAMIHGGPYPASTNFGATSVGTLSIRRFLRPVCYQNMPQDLLPEDLHSKRGAWQRR
jgi:NADP-dependent aldehyde dehydrogenase